MPHHFGTMKLKGKGVTGHPNQWKPPQDKSRSLPDITGGGPNSTEWKTTPSLTRPDITGGGPNQWTPSQDKSHSLQPIGGSLSSQALARLEALRPKPIQKPNIKFSL